MQRWFCHSGDAKMVWFCHSGDAKMVWFCHSGYAKMVWFCHSGDVEKVWFCHSGDVEMVWFWWLGRSKDGMVLILGRCWYSLVVALGRRQRLSDFGVPRETLVQSGFSLGRRKIHSQTPYVSRVRTASPESDHAPPEGKIPRETYQTLTWLYMDYSVM